MSQTPRETSLITDPDWDVYAERVHAERLMVMQFQKDYGANVIRSLFLLNGGAAVAILALIGSLFGKDGKSAELVAGLLFKGARPALVCFGIGLLATVFANTMGYFNFNGLMAWVRPAELHRVKKGGQPAQIPQWAKKSVLATFYGAPLCCLLSAACFFRGGLFISHAMTQVVAHLLR